MTSTDTDKTENTQNSWVAVQSQLKELEVAIHSIYSQPGKLAFDVGNGETLSISRSDVLQLYSQCSICLDVLTSVDTPDDKSLRLTSAINNIFDEIKSEVNKREENITPGFTRNNFSRTFLAKKIAQILYILHNAVPASGRIELIMPDTVLTLASLSEKSDRKNDIGDVNRRLVNMKNQEKAATSILSNIKEISGEIEVLHTKISAESTMIEEALKKLRGVDDHFAKANEKIDGLLTNASKIGLAKSFQDRRKSLEDTQKLWGVIFLAGIALMVGGVIFEQGILPPIVGKNGVDINAVLVRMLFAAPLVWLTWFAARQFGNNARLIEDYAFKESSALAYHGYKNEFLGDQDHETLTVLRKVAAENFGANPSRMLSGQEAASPLHELLEGALKKESFDKIVTVLNALNPKAKDDSAAKKDDKKGE